MNTGCFLSSKCRLNFLSTSCAYSVYLSTLDFGWMSFGRAEIYLVTSPSVGTCGGSSETLRCIVYFLYHFCFTYSKTFKNHRKLIKSPQLVSLLSLFSIIFALLPDADKVPCRSCERNFRHDAQFLFLFYPSWDSLWGAANFAASPARNNLYKRGFTADTGSAVVLGRKVCGASVPLHLACWAPMDFSKTFK